MPRPVALLVRHHAPSSAVGADIEGMRRALEAAGHPARVFAHEGDAAPMAEFPGWARAEGATTILHSTIAWPAGTAAFLQAPGPRVLRFHNVTPPRYFLRWSPAWAVGAALGRAETRLFARTRGLDLLLACSAFSQQDLVDRGADPQRTAILPPWERPAARVTPDASTLARLDDGRTNLLFVGRVTPHKGLHHLVAALAAWRRRWPQDPVRLVLVGGSDPRLSSYEARLKREIARAGLKDHVEQLGEVPQAVLEACYARATVFLLASAHEGFCVPIVEAFRRKVPVVAVSRTAVPETAGNAAVLLPDFDPERMAEAAHRLALDSTERTRLAEAGARRAEERYGRGGWDQEFARLIGPILQ